VCLTNPRRGRQVACAEALFALERGRGSEAPLGAGAVAEVSEMRPGDRGLPRCADQGGDTEGEGGGGAGGGGDAGLPEGVRGVLREAAAAGLPRTAAMERALAPLRAALRARASRALRARRHGELLAGAAAASGGAGALCALMGG